MQNSYRLAPELGYSPTGAALSKYPFAQIKFMRLIVWRECETPAKPKAKSTLAGQFFQSFCLPFMKGVFMDFCLKDATVEPRSTWAMGQILSHPHVVGEKELHAVEEILTDRGVAPLDPDNSIDHAQVGDLDGTPALAIEWTDTFRGCKRISVYMDCQRTGKTLQVIHFSAPLESFDMAKKYFSEVLRSLQWYD